MSSTHQCNLTAAEILLAIARHIRLPEGKLMVAQPGVQDWQVAQWKVAVDFDRRDAGFKFRAVFEEWSEERIILEMY